MNMYDIPLDDFDSTLSMAFQCVFSLPVLHNSPSNPGSNTVAFSNRFLFWLCLILFTFSGPFIFRLCFIFLAFWYYFRLFFRLCFILLVFSGSFLFRLCSLLGIDSIHRKVEGMLSHHVIHWWERLNGVHVDNKSLHCVCGVTINYCIVVRCANYVGKKPGHRFFPLSKLWFRREKGSIDSCGSMRELDS